MPLIRVSDQSLLQASLAYLKSAAVTAILFVAIGATLINVDIPAPQFDQPIEETYIAPPPPPPPPAATKPIEFSEEDFALPISPEPFELSIDLMPVAIGVSAQNFTKVSFDLPSLIRQSADDGLEKLVVYDKSEVDVPPVVRHRVMPKIPPELQLSGKIKALVQYRVTTEGETANVIILDTNAPELSDAIIESIKSWRFKPAIIDGKPVQSWVRHSYVIEIGSKMGSPFQK